MKEQTTAAKHLLSFIQDYYASHRAMPSFAEVGKLVGLSVSTVHFHVNTLKENGFLGATETGRLIPGKGFFKRTIVSTVRAGVPAYADDSTPEGVLIDQYLIDTPSRTFLLTIKGESMRDIGLMPGDVVVVKRGVMASVGDIVVVDANGEGTVKELAQHPDGEYYLKARNSEYPDIAPAEGFEIAGVVVGQFRQYVRAKPAPFVVPSEPERRNAVSLKADLDTGSDAANRGTSFIADQSPKTTTARRPELKVASPAKEPS